MRGPAFALALLAGCPPPVQAPTKPVAPDKAVVETPRPKRSIPPVTVAKARSPFSLEVLGIELVGTIDPKAAKAAHALTDNLRRLAADDHQIALGKKNSELIDLRMMVGCSDDELPCMRRLAHAVGADRIVYGIVNDLKGEYYVHLTLLDAKSGAIVKWTGTMLGDIDEIEYTAKVAFGSLISRTP